ncbi:MAG: hypothetical protein L0H83_04625 [Salinisphaera sp.]|nr:hypothetical protein [Salinisphaera sp.]
MCFSATASFASAAVIAPVGVATLLRADHPNEWLLASLPACFAWHQFNEGMIWLGLLGQLPFGNLPAWGFVYMLYAQCLLPVLIPFSVWLIEPNRPRGHWLWPFVALGAGLAAYVFWALLRFDTEIFLRGHSVVYRNPATSTVLIAALYVVATCGALFFSGYRYLVGLGAANLVGVLAVLYFKHYAFTSVWCAYAAVTSVLIYWHFHRRRRAERQGGVLYH